MQCLWKLDLVWHQLCGKNIIALIETYSRSFILIFERAWCGIWTARFSYGSHLHCRAGVFDAHAPHRPRLYPRRRCSRLKSPRNAQRWPEILRHLSHLATTSREALQILQWLRSKIRPSLSLVKNNTSKVWKTDSLKIKLHIVQCKLVLYLKSVAIK